MARPQKSGIDYFNVDTDIFSNTKIERLCLKYGFLGLGVLNYFWVKIYQNGYYLKTDDDFFDTVSMKMRMEENLIREILDYMVKIRLFNSDIFNKYQILTAAEIQSRYLTIVARRSDVRIIKDIWLTDFPNLQISKYPKKHIELLDSIVFVDVNDAIIEYKPFKSHIEEYLRSQKANGKNSHSEVSANNNSVNVNNNSVNVNNNSVSANNNSAKSGFSKINVNNNPQRNKKQEIRNKKQETRNEKQETRNEKQETRNEKNKFFPGGAGSAPAQGKNILNSFSEESREEINKSPPTKEKILEWIEEMQDIPKEYGGIIGEKYFLSRTDSQWRKTNGNPITNYLADLRKWALDDLADFQNKNGVKNGHSKQELSSEEQWQRELEKYRRISGDANEPNRRDD